MPALGATSRNSPNGVGLLDLIGDTPLIRLDSLTGDLPDVRLYGKAEYLNPGGSVKDRPVGAVRGYPVKLYLPSNASPERKRILAAYGAELVLTDPALQTDGAIQACRAAYERERDACFYPDQYGNPANWRAHYETTGPKIWDQTGGAITHFVTGLGTSGTLMGTGRYLRERNPDVQVVSMQPSTGFHGLEGLKHMATAMQPAIYDPSLADGEVFVDTEDAYDMVRKLACESGLMVGISSGANVVAALRLARQVGRGVIVTVLCDGADKYLSERFWED